MYANPDGSSYARGTPSSSMNTTSDYGARSADMHRAHGEPDAWTSALLDKLGGVPAKADRPGSGRTETY